MTIACNCAIAATRFAKHAVIPVPSAEQNGSSVGKKSKATWSVRVRAYPSGGHVSLWVVRSEGPASAAILWGEMFPQAAEELIAAMGLPVVREAFPVDLAPLQPRECVSVVEQGSLFGEGE